MQLTRDDTPPALPPRPADGHKGMFGRVLVVGGNAGMLGAPSLAGTAALRMGAGLVEVAVPTVILQACLTICPELIGLGLGGTDDVQPLVDAADKADVVVLGPGLGQSPEAAARVKLLTTRPGRMVIDADGLNLLAKNDRWPADFRATAVLTPHPGEMKRLAELIGRDDVPSDEPGRIDIAVQAARAFGQVVVLKGRGTVVTDGHRVYVNHTGDSSLSKAGTGDILSGVAGALLALKMAPFAAAALATHLHGLAGEAAGRRLGLRGVLARDVIDALPDVIREYEQGCLYT